MRRTIPSAEQAARALALKREGAGYRDIAAEMGISVGLAHKLVQRELADIPAADRAQLRDLEAERLDALLVIVWPLAAEGDLAAVKEVRNICESRRRLFGLDAPAQVEFRPDVGTIDIAETAREIISNLQGELPPGEPHPRST